MWSAVPLYAHSTTAPANGKEKVPGKNTGKKPQLTPEQEAEMRALGYR